MHYRVRIYDLNNKSNSPIEFNFEANWLMIRVYALIGTCIMYKHYHKHVNLSTKSEIDSYDLVYYDTKTNKDLLGLSIDENKSPGNFGYST
jgi:hypothetical protein